MTSSSWQFTQFMACLYIQHVCVCVGWGGGGGACVYKYAGAVRTHSHILHYKATGKGCKSNKPVIVSPTSAPSLCFIHTHTHTLLNLFLGLWSQTRNECMTWTPNMTFFFPWQSCSGPSHDWILHKLDVLVKREILDSLVERTRLPVHLGFWFQPRVLWWFWQEKKIYSKIKAFF